MRILGDDARGGSYSRPSHRIDVVSGCTVTSVETMHPNMSNVSVINLLNRRLITCHRGLQGYGLELWTAVVTCPAVAG